MEFQEFPKALYLGDEYEGECVIVADAAEESERRAAGYHGFGEPWDDPRKDDPAERAALVAEAESLGIAVDGRWGDKRIATEIAAKKAQ